MFHAPMGRFQLELIYYFTYFSTVVPYNSCMFLSCTPFVVNTFSTGLVGVEGRRNFNTHKTSWKCCINNERPTGQKQLLGGRTVENKGKLILIDFSWAIFQSSNIVSNLPRYVKLSLLFIVLLPTSMIHFYSLITYGFF